jgi:hypothetical protein
VVSLTRNVDSEGREQARGKDVAHHDLDWFVLVLDPDLQHPDVCGKECIIADQGAYLMLVEQALIPAIRGLILGRTPSRGRPAPLFILFRSAYRDPSLRFSFVWMR